MSLFSKCQWEGCLSIAVLWCSGDNGALRFCQTHSAGFLLSQQQVAQSSRIVLDIASEEKAILDYVWLKLPDLETHLVNVSFENYHQTIRPPLDKAQATSRAFLSHLSRIRQARETSASLLNELISQRQIPTVSDSSMVSALAQLKKTDKMSLQTVFDAVLTDFADFHLDAFTQTVYNVVICKRCKAVGAKRILHTDCSVCSKCFSLCSGRQNQYCPVCELLVCAKCLEGCRPHQKLVCSGGCNVCFTCWHTEFPQHGWCPCCKQQQSQAMASLVYQALGVVHSPRQPANRQALAPPPLSATQVSRTRHFSKYTKESAVRPQTPASSHRLQQRGFN